MTDERRTEEVRTTLPFRGRATGAMFEGDARDARQLLYMSLCYRASCSPEAIWNNRNVCITAEQTTHSNTKLRNSRTRNREPLQVRQERVMSNSLRTQSQNKKHLLLLLNNTDHFGNSSRWAINPT